MRDGQISNDRLQNQQQPDDPPQGHQMQRGRPPTQPEPNGQAQGQPTPSSQPESRKGPGGQPDGQHECDDIVIEVPSDGPGYLPGARLLAVLARPPMRKGDLGWLTAECVLARQFIEARLQLDPSWGAQPQMLIPQHATLPLAVANRRARSIMKVLHARMGTADVLIRRLRSAPPTSGTASGGRRQVITIDQAVGEMLEWEEARREWLRRKNISESKRFDGTVNNFENRALRPSLPVGHLAIAVALAIQRSQNAAKRAAADLIDQLPRDYSGPQISLAHFLTDRDLALAVIAEAESYEELLNQPPIPRRRSNQPQVRLRVS